MIPHTAAYRPAILHQPRAMLFTGAAKNNRANWWPVEDGDNSVDYGRDYSDEEDIKD